MDSTLAARDSADANLCGHRHGATVLLTIALLLLPGLAVLPVHGVSEAFPFVAASGPSSLRPASAPAGSPSSSFHSIASAGRPSSADPVAIVDLAQLTDSVGSPALNAPVHAGAVTLTPGRASPGASPAPLATARPSVISVGVGFRGMNDSQCGCSPPDVADAVGPTQVVEMVNLYVEVWTKSGVELKTLSAPSFFASGTDFLSDPRVLYDNESGRWFASIFDAGPSGTGLARLAVSNSSDATGRWTIYTAVKAPSGEFPDQPILGVSTDLVALGGNMFSESSSAFFGAEYWVVDKAALLNGSSAAVQSWGPDPNFLSIHPVQSLSTTTTQYLVSTTSASNDNVTMLAISGVPPSSTVRWITYNVSAYAIAPVARAPAGGAIDAADTRVQTAVWQSGHLWLAFDDSCTPAGDTTTRACVRVLELSTTNLAVLQDFDYGLSGMDLYYPALSLDTAGDLTMVFGYSSNAVYPSGGVTGQAFTDPVGSLQAYRTVVAGTATVSCGTVCRYGDYFGAATDPNSSTVWVAAEYVTSGLIWNSWLAPVRTHGPVEAVVSVTPGSVDLGTPVTIALSASNLTCAPEFGSYCAASIPVGDGSTLSVSCTAVSMTVASSHTFASVGSYSVAFGGYVASYSTPGCLSGTETTNLTLAPVVVEVSPTPALALAATPPNGADVGQTIHLVATVSGGRAPFVYRWSDLPSGCADTGAAWVNCTVGPFSGSLTIVVNATDANGAGRTQSLDYLISPALLTSVLASRLNVDVGEPLTFQATATGGTGTYAYAWAGLPTGCTGGNVSTLVCVPTSPGSFATYVGTVDTNGFLVNASTVTIEVHPRLLLSVAVPTNGVVGRSAELTAAVAGGVTPYTLSWSGLPAGCTSANTTTLSCTPTSTGTYSVRVEVIDAVGGTANATVSWTLSEPPSALAFGTWTLIIVLAAVLVVGAVAGLLLLRRRRRSARAPSTTAPPRS